MTLSNESGLGSVGDSKQLAPCMCLLARQIFWGVHIGAATSSFGRFIAKQSICMGKYRPVNVLKIFGKLTDKILFAGKKWSLHVNAS